MNTQGLFLRVAFIAFSSLLIFGNCLGYAAFPFWIFRQPVAHAALPQNTQTKNATHFDQWAEQRKLAEKLDNERPKYNAATNDFNKYMRNHPDPETIDPKKLRKYITKMHDVTIDLQQHPYDYIEKRDNKETTKVAAQNALTTTTPSAISKPTITTMRTRQEKIQAIHDHIGKINTFNDQYREASHQYHVGFDFKPEELITIFQDMEHELNAIDQILSEY